jgi:hypothetical protein
MTVDFNQIQEIYTGGYQISAVWKNGECIWLETLPEILPTEEVIPTGTPVYTGINNFNFGNSLWW